MIQPLVILADLFIYPLLLNFFFPCEPCHLLVSAHLPRKSTGSSFASGLAPWRQRQLGSLSAISLFKIRLTLQKSLEKAIWICKWHGVRYWCVEILCVSGPANCIRIDTHLLVTPIIMHSTYSSSLLSFMDAPIFWRAPKHLTVLFVIKPENEVATFLRARSQLP